MFLLHVFVQGWTSCRVNNIKAWANVDLILMNIVVFTAKEQV